MLIEKNPLFVGKKVRILTDRFKIQFEKRSLWKLVSHGMVPFKIDQE